MLNSGEKKKLLDVARKSIVSFLENNDYLPEKPKEIILNSKTGVFVTLNKNNHLRGCIGYIVGVKPLYIAVYEMARQAAFHDPRFEAVTLDECEDIEIEISIMSPLEKETNLEKIEIGKHGLFMKRGHYSGLLLPQVAVEWNYDRESFLRQTCLKAGMDEQCYQDNSTEIYTFFADIIKESDNYE